MEFKNKKEWEAFVDKGLADGKTPQEMNKLAGKYDGPEGRFSVQQAQKSKRGWTPVNLAVRAKRGKKRADAGKAQDQAMLDTLKKGGLSDKEAKAVLKKEKQSYKRIEARASALSKELGIKGAIQAGHETGKLKGGIDSGRNARLERGRSTVKPDGTIVRGNQSRGLHDEFSDKIKPSMGIPRSGRGGEDTALMNLLEIDENPKIMDLGLTPKNKQDMKVYPGDPNEIIQARQKQLAAIEEVKTSGKPISKAQALRIARMTAPMWLSLGFGTAALGASVNEATQNPSFETFEDATWDGLNLLADAASLVPLLAVPAEGAQKLLGVAHQARVATRNLENTKTFRN